MINIIIITIKLMNECRLYFQTHKNSVVSWTFIALATYFLFYLILRNPSAYIINSSIIVAAILFCVGISLYLQLRKPLDSINAPVPCRPEIHFGQMFSEARREHLLNNLRRDPDPKPDTIGITPQYTRISPYAASPVPTLTTAFKPPEATFGRGLGCEPQETEKPLSGEENKRSSLAFGLGLDKKWDSPKKEYTYQGDVMDYESQSSNALALDLYEKMGIKRKVPVWAENVRSWMAGTFIPMILTKHYENLEQLNKVLAYYNRRVIFYRTEDIMSTAGFTKLMLWEELLDIVTNNSLGLGFPPTLQPTVDQFRYSSMNEAQIRALLKELVQDRAIIEKYLRLQDYNVSKREYVIERLKQLQANFIAEYKNNGGMDWRGEPWNPSLPKDSDVLLIEEN